MFKQQLLTSVGRSSGKFSLIFILFCLLCFADQLVLNTANLPIGFEEGKVWLVRFLGAAALIQLYLYLNFQLFFHADNLRAAFRIFFKHYYWLALFCLGIFSSLWISTVTSPNTNYAFWGSEFRFNGLITHLSLLIIFVYLVVFFKRNYLKVLLNIFLFILVIQALLALKQAVALSWEVISQGYYVNGNFGQANFFGGSMVAGWILVLLRLLFPQEKLKLSLKLWYLGLSALFSVVIFLSFSYGSWLVAVAATAFILGIKIFRSVSKLKLTQKRIKIITIGIIIAFMAFEIWVINSFEPGRSTIWAAMNKLIPQRLIFGFGADNLGLVMFEQQLLPGRHVDRAHSLYLDLLFNFGLFQFAIWSGMAGYLIRKLKLTAATFPVLAIILLFLVSGIFQEKSIYHSLEFVVWLGILAKLILTGKKTTTELI